MASFAQFLTGVLQAIPTIQTTAVALQQVGHTQQSTVSKILNYVDIAAKAGENAHQPTVAGVSALVDVVVGDIYQIVSALHPGVTTTTTVTASVIGPTGN
jgi:hypothetical protein